MYIISIIILVAYTILLWVLIRGAIKIKHIEKSSKQNSFSVFISVLIAVRNEENYILDTLNALAKQNYPITDYEVIIVDDASEDSSYEKVEQFCKAHKNFKSLSFKEHKGKKTAIDFAVKRAKGRLIATTDGDCIPVKTWISEIYSAYMANPSKMIIAPVLMNFSSVFEAMQALDFFSLMISGIAAAAYGKPIMNNAANLIFEKQAYLSLKNPNKKEISSGDDVFFLLNIKKQNPDYISVIKSNKAVVYTHPEKSLKSFINQRKRWTSKSKYYRDVDIIFTSFTVFFINIFLLISFILSFFLSKAFFVFSFVFIIKSLFDFIFLYPEISYFKQTSLLKYFLPVQLINIFLIPFIALSGLFFHGNWKGKTTK